MRAISITVFFLMFLLLSPALLAQETNLSKNDFPKNEINLGYGMLTGVEIANAMAFPMFGIMGIAIMRDTIKDFNPSAYGCVSFNYQRYITRWVSVGGTLSLNPVTMQLTSKHGLDLSYSMYLLSVMPRVNFYYINKGLFSLYSGLEAGCTLGVYSDRSGTSNQNSFGSTFAFQLNTIGMRIGKEIGGYMEFGFGFRGMVNFGISGRF